MNEILESYVFYQQSLPTPPGPDGLAAAKPNESSEGMTSDALLANPENVSDAAYDRLATARFPFTLPYSQPIDAQRCLPAAPGDRPLRDHADLWR